MRLAMPVLVVCACCGVGRAQVSDDEVNRIIERFGALRMQLWMAQSGEETELGEFAIHNELVDLQRSIPLDELTFDQLRWLGSNGVLSPMLDEGVTRKTLRRLRTMLGEEGLDGARAACMHAAMMAQDRAFRRGHARHIGRALRLYLDHPRVLDVPPIESDDLALTLAGGATQSGEVRGALHDKTEALHDHARRLVDTDERHALRKAQAFIDLLWATELPAWKIRALEINVGLGLATLPVGGTLDPAKLDLPGLYEQVLGERVEFVDADMKDKLRDALRERVLEDPALVERFRDTVPTSGTGLRTLGSARVEMSFARGVESCDDLTGDIVIGQVWATWDHRCKETFDEMRALQERYAEEVGVRVVGILPNYATVSDFNGNTYHTIDATPEELRRFYASYLDDADITWDILVIDPYELRLLDAYRAPVLFVLDREGHEVYRRVHATYGYDEVGDFIDRMLEEGDAADD